MLNSRRRAKIKMIAKKSVDGGEDFENIPEPMRQMLAMQAMDGKPFARQFMGRPGLPLAHYGSGGMMMNGDPNGAGKVGA